jgi:hypothetical protein
VYFSTFEPIDLTPDSIMQRAGVPTLYDAARNLNPRGPRLPCLYICPVATVLGRSPLILWESVLHQRQQSSHIPYRFKDDQRIRHTSANTQRDWGNSSRLWEVNTHTHFLASLS